MTTIEELRERVEVVGPKIVTGEVRDEDGEPTGETFQQRWMSVGLDRDGVLYFQRIRPPFDASDDFVRTLRDEAVREVVHQAFHRISDRSGSDAAGGVDLAAHVRPA